MKALPWRTAKSKIGLSAGRGGVFSENTARQDDGDFSGALGGGELVGWGEELGRHVVSRRSDKELDTIVRAELALDHPGISSV
ncbi:hypothetical protein EWI61_14580 [Methylolobus aquaticus]|nr:hypothetical protein EWI61_14580 [Methylolobus aquaticus]